MANVVIATTVAFVLCITLFCSNSANSHPITSADKCRTGCHGTPTNFKYAEGTTYKYNLESTVDITLSSAEGQQSATKLKATVLLTQQAQCVQVLRLQNVQIFGGDGKKKGSIANVEKAIKINFHDGHIEDVICTESGETQVSLNIKRAVASLFQAALKSTTETDVFGVCPTSISTSKDGNVVTFLKSRSLNQCSHRESAKHDFMTTAFNLNSEIKSSPILKSDYSSEMKVKDGILDHVLVTETYLYMPFSVGKNGARATVQTKLQLSGKSKDQPKSKCQEPRSIIFENPHPIISDKSDVKTILDAVKDTANSITDTVGPKTASKFGQLITIMSGGKKDDLLAVYNQVQSGAGFTDKEKGKKVFLDALFRAGTGDCLEVSIQLLKSKQLSPLEEKMVYLGMSFIRHATPESIATSAALLDMPKLPREAYLGIGTLTNHYCRSHDCHNLEQIKTLSGKLLAKLKDGKASNREVENEMIAVLKSLSNMKHLADNVVPKVIAIAQDKKNSMRLRVAALEAYASDMCKDKLRDSAIGILKDTQQDAEIRIKAYLALAACPNGKAATAVKNLLDTEPSYHVMGFIVSHIRCCRASTNTDLALCKHEFGNINTSRKFPIDPRKYSFFDELSYSVDTLGTSSSVEYNVIYSQNSFLPRHINFNMTTELFGHRMNFLQIDARQENLDRLMEHYFGPLGVLRNKEHEELIKSGKTSMANIAKHLRDRLTKTRGKRNVPKNEIDAMGKAVQIKTNELNTDLDLDLSLKVFGSEFLFLTLNDHSDQFTPEKIIDKIFDGLDSGIEKVKNYQHTFTRNGIFMDAELAYPTSSGFPLKLSIEGTDSVQLIAESKVDVRALLQGAKNSVLQLKLIPSANIDMSGRLTLDALVVESGLKVTSTVHTATGGSLNLEFFQTGVDAKFNLPIEKQELINAEHQLVFITRDSGHGEVETPLKFVESKPLDICFDTLEQVIGLSFCAKLNSPNPQLNQGSSFLPYPFNGNSQFSVFITREKPITYHFRDILYNDEKKGFEFIVEVLDEANKPMVSFGVDAFAHPEKYIRASLDSPIKKAVLEGRIIDNDKEKSIGAKFQHDNQEYSGKLGITVTGNAAKATYKPLIELITPEQGKQQSPYTVEGQVIAEKSGDNVKYTFDKVKLISPSTPAITITGNLGRESGAYFTDLKLEDGTNSATVKGKLQATPNLIKIDAKVMNTLSPVSNFHLDYELKRDENSLSNDLTFVHGGDLNNKQQTLKLKNSVMRKYTDSNDYQFQVKNQFSYPVIGLEAKFNINKVPKSLDYNIEGKYNKAKLSSKLNAKYNQKTIGDYDVNLDAEALENKLSAKAKREINGDVSTIDHSLEINGKKAEVKGTITHKHKAYDTNIGCDLTIQIPQIPEIIAVKQGFTHTADQCKSHLKIAKGSETIVDYDMTGHKVNGAKGHLKANLKDIMNIDGDINAPKWNGKAQLTVELLKVQRKLKLDSTFNVAKPKLNFAVNFYPNFEKSPQKISLQSENEVTENNLESKNKLDIFENAFESNVKFSQEGLELGVDGKVNAEGDLTLPNGLYFAGKLIRDLKTVDGKSNGKAQLNLEQRTNKNTAGRKLTLNAEVRNSNLKEGNVDLTYNLVLDDSNGKNINADLSIKNTRGEGSCTTDVTGKIFGSVLAEPIEFTHKSEVKNKIGKYSTTSKCKNSNMKLDGAYDVSGGKNPLTGSINFDLNTNNPKVKTIKFSANGKLLKEEHNLDMGGATKLFIDDDGTNPDTTVDFQADGDLNLGHHSGSVKGTVKAQKLEPVTVAVGYGHKEEAGVMKCQADASLKYSTGKHIKADVSLIRPTHYEGKIELKLETPFENMKKSDVVMNYKRSEDNKQMSSDLTATVDGKPYSSKSEIRLSETNPLLHFEVTHDGHTDKIYLSSEHPAPHIYKGESILAHGDDIYTSSYEYNIPSIDDFTILAKLHAPKQNYNNYVFDLKNKKNKVIEVSVSGNGEELVKGNANYKVRDETGKYVVEGTGEFTVKNEKKTGNFKFIRQMLTMDKNHEQGVGVSLDITLGNHAVDAEFKMTNKQFRIMNSYCKEKNQCEHFEIDSKSNVISVTEYDNELEIRIELASHDFGMKAVSKRKNLQFDHTTDVHYQTKDNKKYQYSLYIHPKQAGLSLTTPKRQVAVESKFDVAPKFKGPAKFEINFYLDKKNEPTKKTSLTGVAEYTGTDKTGKFTAETKLQSPGLTRDLVISYNNKYDISNKVAEATMIIDIFAQQNSKIVATGKTQVTRNGDNGQYGLERHASIKSTGMGIDIAYDEILFSYDSKTHTFKTMSKATYNMHNHKCVCLSLLELSPTKFTTKLQLHNKELLVIDSKLKMTKEEQTIDTDAKIFGMKPMTSTYSLKNFNTLKYTLAPKDNPSKKLTVNAAFIPGQIADFRADVENKELLKASIQLDEANFLKPDYAMNMDNIQKLVLQPAKREVDNIIKEGKTMVEDSAAGAKKTAEQAGELAKKHIPNLKGVRDYYSSEWNKVSAEINADPNIQKASQFMHKAFGTVAKITSEFISQVVAVLEQLATTLKNTIIKVSEAFDTEIWPQIKTTMDNLYQVTHKLANNLSDILFGIIAKINAFLDSHQAEFKQIATSLSTLSQDFGRFLQKNYDRIRTLITENAKKLYEEIKALPIYEEIKSRYDLVIKDFGDWGEPLMHMIDDTLNTLQDIIPNEDAKKIVDSIRVYIQKKLKKEAVDDFAALENIVKSIMVFVRKITSQYKLADLRVADPNSWFTNYFYAMPKVWRARNSFFDFFTEQDDGPWESIPESLYGVSFNPRSWFGPPFRMYAYVIQGQHIFTFDGKHITFPGSCNYLLARDAINGNFTIAGTYNNGLLTALTYADPTESVTIKKGGQLMHGKTAAEFPLRIGQIEAFRTHSKMNIYTKAGVEITCDPNLVVCKISISGFYHGHLRGLLGNGNHEAYDDFTQPNGKIVQSESDFANSYKMTASCKPVTTVDHSQHKRAPACTELFTSSSSLRICYPFVNPELYRTACDHGVAANVKDTEEAIARGYVTACNAKFVPAVLPNKFMTCTNADQTHNVGETFSVKLPGKAADIVLIVDQAKFNEPIYKELVQPLVSELTKELATKGVTDVEFYLIGYGGEYQKYPSHFTSGGKLKLKGKLPAMKFTEAPKEEPYNTGNDKLDKLLTNLRQAKRDLELALGLDIQAMTFIEAYSHAFRAHATKTIIAFTQACGQGNLLPLQKLRLLLFNDKSVHINSVTTFNDFKVKDAKVTKSVVGFDDKHVFVFGDAKKKSAGNTELHKELEINDYCSDFVVKRGGAVFNSDNFLSAKGPQRQQFTQVVSHTLTEQIVNTAQGMDCRCTVSGLTSARNICTSLFINEKDAK